MTTFVPVDRAARDRIRADLDANLCVEAGAGTGKTSVLVDRVVELLRTGYRTVDELAVITFTEAAAAELSARVRQGLEEALAVAAADERDRVHAALQGLHRAHVETIHAFAASLLRERPVEAGLDPGFEVLDELSARLAFDDAYGDWLHRTLAEERPEIVLALRRGLSLDRLRLLVDEVHRFRSLLPLARETPPSPDVAAFAADLSRIAARLRDLAPLAADDAKGLADIEGILLFADRVGAARADESLLERAILFRAPKIRPGAGSQSNWEDPDDCRLSKKLRREAKDSLEAVQAALRGEALTRLLPLAESFVTDYERARKAEGRADFDDLLEWARDLLAESPEARSYFRRRFPTILVDEFQDTDPVQAEIALCIASDDLPGDDWLRLRPRPGSLTVVGDPKQSIYRFRRADIAAYDAVRRGPLAPGGVELVQNFRSTAGVLSWLNPLFDRVLIEEEGVQPKNTHLEPAGARLPDESRSIVVVHGEPQERAGAVRAEEARLLATTVASAVEEGWLVRDPRTRDVRPMRFGDVVVLVPRRTDLDTYVDAFTRADVPLRAEGGRTFFQRQEVRDLSNLLQAIDDPLDRVALVATLRSSALACSDEEIYLHVAAGNRLDYRHDANGGGPEHVREALALLRELHRRRARVSLAQLVRETLVRTRLVEIALAGWDGRQAAANLVKLADQARAFSAAGSGGLRGFARWLAEQRGSSEVTEASVTEETDDVVRLMTIHSAKGLEFPVVALANLGSPPRNEIEPVPDRRARRLHLRVLVEGAEFKTPGFDAAWAGEEAQQQAEDKRLLYVATTRARDHLIIPVASRPKERSMLADLDPSLPHWEPESAGTVVDGAFLIDREALPALPEDQPPPPLRASADEVDAALAERERWAEEQVELMRRARDQLDVFPATRDEGDAPVTGALLGADDAPLIAGHGPPLPLGEALHKVLELVDLRDPHDIEAVAESVCLVAGIEEHADEVLAMAHACLASDALTRALRTDDFWREVPYTVRVEGGYATGRIDLVFRENGGLVALDWKSDSVAPSQVAAAAEAHRAQAEAYARALAAGTKTPVNEVVFVFARAGGASGSIRGAREHRWST